MTITGVSGTTLGVAPQGTMSTTPSATIPSPPSEGTTPAAANSNAQRGAGLLGFLVAAGNALADAFQGAFNAFFGSPSPRPPAATPMSAPVVALPSHTQGPVVVPMSAGPPAPPDALTIALPAPVAEVTAPAAPVSQPAAVPVVAPPPPPPVAGETPTAPIAPPPPATEPVAAPVTAPPARPPFEPKAFLYDDRFFKKFHAAGGIDVKDMNKVEDRIIRATFAYILAEEPDVDDLGITEVRIRLVDPIANADLLRVNPRALYIVDVIGVQGDGTERTIPSVFNSDGAVFVDPRIRAT